MNIYRQVLLSKLAIDLYTYVHLFVYLLFGDQLLCNQQTLST